MNGIINSNVNFNGFRLTKMKYNRKECQAETALMLGEKLQDVVNLTQKATSKRMAFWQFLSNKYNDINFYKKLTERENPIHVNNIFKNVKRPRKLHYDIVFKYKNSFEDLDRIFSAINGKRSRLNFTHKLLTKIFVRDSFEKKIVPELLESPFSPKYVKDYKNIKSYLILNKDNPDAVKQLDEMYETKTFDHKFFDRKLRDENIKKSWPFEETDILNSEEYLKSYSKPVEKFVSAMRDNFDISLPSLQEGMDKELLNMIKTTTKRNVKFRTEFLAYKKDEYVTNNFLNHKSTYIADLNKLFELTDKDKHSCNFVKSIQKSQHDFQPKEINEVLEKFPPKKLDIFHSNAIRIMSKTNGQERIDALEKEIKNPFFETERSLAIKQHNIECNYTKKDSILSKIYASAVNCFNIIRFSLTKKENSPLERVSSQLVRQEVKNIKPVEAMPIEIEASAIEPVKNLPNDTSNDVLSLAPARELETQNATTSFTTKKTNKEIVADNVFSTIRSKLSSKTMDKQREAYLGNATKMRFSMLPEIFASVADTRKADRVVGKYKSNSSNKDVLDLYLKINGNNKKLVNYMLKKRNVDNTRMFEIKDIITTINKAEAKIKKDKEINPNYRARDARIYYNHLYEAKIQQYGKVKHLKNINTKA